MDPLYLDARAAAPRCVVRHADIGAPGLKLDRLEENHGGDLPRPRVLVGLAQQVYEAVAIRALAAGRGGGAIAGARRPTSGATDEPTAPPPSGQSPRG